MGCFLKTPSSIVAEVLSRTPLDVVCIDCEHASFDRLVLDQTLAVCSAADLPSLVRVPSPQPDHILGALDSGATGVLVPHIASGRAAREIVQAAHYGPGGRSFAGTTRAGDFAGRSIAEHLERAAEETVVVAQIEDVEALDALDEIMSVEGIDAVFVGRIDLTVALGETDPMAPRVVEAVERIVQGATGARKVVGMFTSTIDDALAWRKKGASFFLLGSDHGFIAQGAAALMRSFQSSE